MEDIIKTFHRTSISLARLLFGVKDPYFMRKVFEKSEGLSQACINFVKSVGDSSTSNRDNLVATIGEIIDLCDYIEHLNLSPATSLVVLKKNLFLLKLQVLKYDKKEATTPPTQSILPKKKKIDEGKNSTVLVSTITKEKKIDGNRQRILDFVCHFPNTRTKEIIDEFTSLSQRTVKRTLKELVAEGRLQKRSESNAVFYFPSNVN